MNPFGHLLIALMMQRTEEDFLVPHDKTTKEVGDKVEITDPFLFNYFIDIETDCQVTKDRNHLNDSIKEDFTCQPMIVVANNLNKTYKCGHCESDHHHDIIVYMPKLKKRYFTSSDAVKHITV